MGEVHLMLLRRAEKAIAEAKEQYRQTAELGAFLSALRQTDPGRFVRCAWCGRVAAGEHWIDPSRFLGGNLRERLRTHASHGICPECLERVQGEARRARARQRR